MGMPSARAEAFISLMTPWMRRRVTSVMVM